MLSANIRSFTSHGNVAPSSLSLRGSCSAQLGWRIGVLRLRASAVLVAVRQALALHDVLTRLA